MAGKEQRAPIVVIRDAGTGPEEWEKLLGYAREKAQAEARTLVIVERPQHTTAEQERVEQKIAAAARDLINVYIERMEDRIEAGDVTPAEREEFERWKRKYIQEESGK